MADPSDEPVTTGMLDGRYVLADCVGQGGMARVYRAEDVVLGRTVAIKIMRSEAENPAILPRARTEMSLLASLNHPSLVTLFDAKIVPGQPEYLVMEFVEGQSLAVALQTGPLDAAETAGLVGEIAAGLEVVHRSGIVHRDVKPSNVLLAPPTIPGRRHGAKLADFGVAYLADSTRHTTPGTVIGTAAYLAPEQVRGEPAGPPADVYALGLLALETITGDRAFPEASGIGRVMARLVETPDVPSWLGPEWSALLREMIARDPAERPTAGQVAHRARSLPTDIVRMPRPAVAAIDQETQALDLGYAAAPVEAVGAPAVSPLDAQASRRAARTRRRSRHSRTWILTGAAGVVVAAHIAIGAWWANGAPGQQPAPEQTVSEPTSPAPAELVVDDGEQGLVPLNTTDTVDTVAENDPVVPDTATAETNGTGDESAIETPGSTGADKTADRPARENANEKAQDHANENSAVRGGSSNSKGNGNGNGKND
ncbi:serine/threonine-protein kinase [Microbacterium sp. MM2322]|uniref:serine/threonine-protein kinase n=1 Tax=Microbacterium sp. MM2322 TaxID=3157631 RepID=UPI0032D59C75